MTILMMDVIEELGGVPFNDPASTQSGRRLAFGPIVAEAVTTLGRFLRECVVLTCVAREQRTMSLLETELPIQVDSLEQGKALLGYLLRDQIPRELQPAWLSRSNELDGYLPWRCQN
jgi:hypothetical protein